MKRKVMRFGFFFFFLLFPVSVYDNDRQRNLGMANMAQWASAFVTERRSFFLQCLLREGS